LACPDRSRSGVRGTHWGKLGLKAVLQPAITLARDGVQLTYEEAQSMHNKELEQFPDSKRIFQRAGKFYEPGELFRQPELARTLERIAAKPDEFYKGAMARSWPRRFSVAAA